MRSYCTCGGIVVRGVVFRWSIQGVVRGHALFVCMCDTLSRSKKAGNENYTGKKQILISNFDLHRTRIQQREGGFGPEWVSEVFSNQMRRNHSNDRLCMSRNISRSNAETNRDIYIKALSIECETDHLRLNCVSYNLCELGELVYFSQDTPRINNKRYKYVAQGTHIRTSGLKRQQSYPLSVIGMHKSWPDIMLARGIIKKKANVKVTKPCIVFRHRSHITCDLSSFLEEDCLTCPMSYSAMDPSEHRSPAAKWVTPFTHPLLLFTNPIPLYNNTPFLPPPLYSNPLLHPLPCLPQKLLHPPKSIPRKPLIPLPPHHPTPPPRRLQKHRRKLPRHLL